MQTMMFKSLDRGPILVSAARFSHAQTADDGGGMTRVTLYFDTPDLPEIKKNFETPKKAEQYLEALQKNLATGKPLDLDTIADRITQGASSASPLRQF
ncbi:hypothetical protein [Kocuria rhizophila]|uniref:hypothetical protein n=1 Tax=Kocuria rhizophila TaxID=72000 RepID=UPI003D6E1A96